MKLHTVLMLVVGLSGCAQPISPWGQEVSKAMCRAHGGVKKVSEGKTVLGLRKMLLDCNDGTRWTPRWSEELAQEAVRNGEKL